MTGVPRVVNSRETNSVTYMKYNTNKIINRHSEPADKYPSFQVMLVEGGHKVILEVSN